MKTYIQNHGFIPDEIKAEDYVLGGYSKIQGEVIMADGQWGKYLPEREIQKQYGIETYNCTAYATLNCLETLLAFHDEQRRIDDGHIGTTFNFSDRFTGIMAGTTMPGNSPHKVIESIRKNGLIDDELLPFENVKNIDEYYSPVEAKHIIEGQIFLNKHTIQHEWVFTGGTVKQKQNKMMEALKYSPLGASVLAWKEKGGLYYKEVGEMDTHWTTIYGYNKGEYWECFDSYDNTNKKLVWDYDFGYAKRYHIEANTQQINWIKDLFDRLFGFNFNLVTI